MDRKYDSGNRKFKVLITVAVLALMTGIAIFTTSAAFTATSVNDGNSIAAGTVAIGDSDADTGKLYNATNVAPGTGNGPTAACIRVTYSGSLASSVRLYRAAVSNGDKFHLTVERGGNSLTGPASNMNCNGFNPEAGAPAFDDTLDQFPTTYASGVPGKSGGAAWTTGQSVDYRFTIHAVDDSTPNAHTTPVSTGAHAFTWEAQNN